MNHIYYHVNKEILVSINNISTIITLPCPKSDNNHNNKINFNIYILIRNHECTHYNIFYYKTSFII